MALTEIPFQGRSMGPIYNNAESVFVELFEAPQDMGHIPVGEVVLYKEPQGEWVCHRLIAKDGANYYLKGDLNTTMEVKSYGVAWGIVYGFSKNEKIYGTDRLFARKLICKFQKKQCEAKSYMAKKTYRVASLSLLLFNKLFSIRKYNHLKS